jgi:probable HAF family extracellular repeat protein
MGRLPQFFLEIWMKSFFLALTLLYTMLAAPVLATSYQIIDLGAIAPAVYAYDINNHSQVVGEMSWSGSSVAFVQSGAGAPQPIPGTPDRLWSYANRINELGQATGRCGANAALWKNGIMVNLGTLPGGYSSYGRGINDNGQVVGDSTNTDYKYHAFLWDSVHGMQDIGVGTAYDINNAGQVVGYNWPSAFIWDAEHGTQTVDGVARLYAINNRGDSAGITNHSTSLVRWRDGTLMPLQTPESTYYTQAGDINELGQSVGFAHNGYDIPVVWDAAGNVQRLPTFYWWGSEQACGINDQGQIVGYVVYDMLTGPHGVPEIPVYHAVLWQPVPEPSALVVLACGLASFSGLRRRSSITACRAFGRQSSC